MFKKSLLRSVVVIMTLTLASVAFASSTYTDKQKDAFASTYKQIFSVHKTLQKKVTKDMTKEQQMKLSRKLQMKAKKIMDSQKNMDKELYQNMMMAMKTDKSLMQDIQKRLR